MQGSVWVIAGAGRNITVQVRHLTYVIYIVDPVYLAEPLVRSGNFVRMSGIGEGNWTAATPCEPAEETTSPPHEAPHYLPGENPFITEQAPTVYPEYRLKLRDATSARK